LADSCSGLGRRLGVGLGVLRDRTEGKKK
jgi:hypothetical protein